jgi:hypothetical protein
MKMKLGRGEKAKAKGTKPVKGSKKDVAEAKDSRKKRARGGGGGGGVGVKEKLTLHGEKIVLGIAVLFALGLLYTGFSSSREVDATRTPTHLVSQVTQAKQRINQPRWDTVYKPQRLQNLRLTERAQRALADISVDSYTTPQPWKPLIFPPRTKRSDPQLIPAQELMVEAGVAAVAIRREGTFTERTAADTTAETRSVSAKDLDEWEEGGAGESSGGSGEAETLHFACVKALVPFQQQIDKYNEVFQDSSGYNAARDFPNYFTFFVERAEVKPDGSELVWERLKRYDDEMTSRFASSPQEIAGRDYVIELDTFSGANFKLPPLMRQNLERWALHPRIPREEHEEGFSEGPLNEGRAEAEIDPFEAARRGNIWSEEEGSHFEESTHIEEGSYGMREKVTEYKLVRYFDYQVEPGKSYRYRIQLFLEDPNDPADVARALNPQMLSNDVMVRLRTVYQDEETKKYAHFRATDWSQPSAVVTIPSGHQMIAGTVTPARSLSLPGRNTRLTRPYDEPKVKLVVVQWDTERASPVPVEIEARRGMTGVFTKTTEFLPSGDNRLEQLKDYEFQAQNSVLVDIAGGEPVFPRQRDIVSPGEIVVIDETGNVVIRSELDDIPAFDRYTFEPPEDRDGGPKSRGQRRRGRRGDDEELEEEFINTVPEEEKI